MGGCQGWIDRGGRPAMNHISGEPRMSAEHVAESDE